MVLVGWREVRWEMKGWFKSKTSIQEYRNEIQNSYETCAWIIWYMFLVQCEELRINHLTLLLVVTMPYVGWLLWPMFKIEVFNALQILRVSKQPSKMQPQTKNEDITWSPQYNRSATWTNKRRALSLQEVELDGWFLILHIVLEHMYHIIHAQVSYEFCISFLYSWIHVLDLNQLFTWRAENWEPFSYEGFNLDHCLWRVGCIEDVKWRLHFQIGVVFWRVVLREVIFWRAKPRLKGIEDFNLEQWMGWARDQALPPNRMERNPPERPCGPEPREPIKIRGRCGHNNQPPQWQTLLIPKANFKALS